MKSNLSQEQLGKSLDRRIRHLMIKTLEKFEDAFSDLENTREGNLFKGDLRTAFNDVLRAQRDELNDYVVEYRPLRLAEDNTVAITQTFMQSVQKVEFGFIGNKPYFSISASVDKIKVLNSLRSELDAGVIFMENEQTATLQIVGVVPCVDSVLIIMDRYRLHADVREKYKQWRSEVVKIYRS